MSADDAPLALPDWEDGTVTILSTGAGPPHAIPVSTAVRAGDRRVLLALARRRETLARLREDARCALTILTTRVACTAHATATILADPMEVADNVAAVDLRVHALQDHLQPAFAVEAGVHWRWTDERARERDAAIRDALRVQAARG